MDETEATDVETGNVSDENVEQPQTPACEDPPPSEPDSETKAAERANQLRFFVTVLTLKVLKECRALKGRTQETWIGQTKRLIEQTILGLTNFDDVFLKSNRTKKVCRSVLLDLQKRFHRRNVLNASILLEDPMVEDALVLSLRFHIKHAGGKNSKSYHWAPAATSSD